MKAGTSSKSKSDELPKNDLADESKDTINGFMDMILHAQRTNEPSIEVSQRIFDHFTRGQKTPYFIYNNIKVYVAGTRSNLEAEGLMAPDDLRVKLHREGRL